MLDAPSPGYRAFDLGRCRRRRRVLVGRVCAQEWNGRAGSGKRYFVLRGCGLGPCPVAPLLVAVAVVMSLGRVLGESWKRPAWEKDEGLRDAGGLGGSLGLAAGAGAEVVAVRVLGGSKCRVAWCRGWSIV